MSDSVTYNDAIGPNGVIDPSKTLYGYFVNSHVALTFIILFALSGLVHLGQSIYYRVWWIIPTMVLCALGEVLGWSARYWSSQSPVALDPFLMQITCTILAPSFMSAGLFIILGILVNQLGPQYSRFTPKVFSIVFMTCDLLALITQAVGGAMASSAFQNGSSSTKGTHIMLGGILCQMVAITLYVLTGTEFFLRYHFDKPVRPSEVNDKASHSRDAVRRSVQLMVFSMIIATLFLYIRTIYRTIELTGGWTGPIIRNQILFDCLDAIPIIVGLATLNILSPGMLLFRTAHIPESSSGSGHESVTTTVVQGSSTPNEKVPSRGDYEIA